MLVLLDLSAAFDTVRHDALLNHLKSRFSADGKALEWFASYLADRTQLAAVNDGLSSAFPLRQGVPLGSCLGLFCLQSTPVSCLILVLVRQRISFKILLFVFKAIHGFAPTCSRELVSIKRSENYNFRSSWDGLLLAMPAYRIRVTLGDRSFQVTALALCNVLPHEICSITDLGISKCHLKTHLRREAFYLFLSR